MKFSNLFGVATTRIFSVLSSLVLSVVAAATLTEHEFGVFTSYISSIAWLSVFQRFGLDRFTLRKVAGLDNTDAIKSQIDIAFSVWAVLQIPLLLCISIFCYFLGDTVFSTQFSLNHGLLLLACSTALSLLFIFADILRGKGYVSIGLLLSGITIPASITLAMLLGRFGQSSTLIGFYLAAAVASIVLALYLVSRLCIPDLSALPRVTFKDWPSFREPLDIMLHTVAAVGTSAYPIIALRFLQGPVAVSDYQKPFLVSMVIGSLVLVITSIYEPRFARANASKNKEDLRTEVSGSFSLIKYLMIASSLFILACVFVIEGFEIGLISVQIVVILGIAQMINLCTAPYQSLFLMKGESATVRKASFLAFCALLISLVPLTLLFGPIGCAIGVMATMAIKLFYYRSIRTALA